MPFLNLRAYLLCSFLLIIDFGSAFASLPADTLNNANSSPSVAVIKPKGYRSIICIEDGFVVAGSDGRIDWLSKSGNITKSEKYTGEDLNSLLSFKQSVIAAGNKGSILVSLDKGVFRRVESGTHHNINSLALFNEKIIAGADNGELLIGDENGSFRKIQLILKGNIVSVSASFSDCYGVTNEGEIIHSKNGIDWNILNFNALYAGYYKPCNFTKVLVTDNRVAVAGVKNDGSPTLFFSSQGNVWTERTLNYTDEQGMSALLEFVPYDIFYDISKDQFLLACSKGKIMTIPSCSHCNKLFTVSTEDIMGIAGDENSIMIVGKDLFIKALDTKWF